MTTNEMNKIMMTDELSNGLVSLLALSYLSEDEQKKIISHYCSYTSKQENCYVPEYSDDMKVSYEAAMASIANLISTDDASFADKLHKEYTNLCNLDVCDYSDVMALSVTYSYLKDICVEEAKKLLNSIKIYLNTVYNFIKNM